MAVSISRGGEREEIETAIVSDPLAVDAVETTFAGMSHATILLVEHMTAVLCGVGRRVDWRWDVRSALPSLYAR